MLGRASLGKQSLTKLATYAAGYSLFELTLTRGYGEAEFREDLKELFKCVSEGPVSFLFTDAHVAKESFLESINNILTTGMVPKVWERP